MKSQSLGPGDLHVGGRYLHRNADWVRTIARIDGDTIHWHDQYGAGTCSARAFLRACGSLAPGGDELGSSSGSNTELTPTQPGKFSLRDEANALTAYAFRNGFLEDLHAGHNSPLLDDPSLSRITDAEMKRLMIEASEKLTEMLRLKQEDPAAYATWLRTYHWRFCRNWKRD